MQARSHKAFNGGNTSSCGVGQRPAFRPCCFLRGPAACVARCAACFAGRAFFRAGAWVRMHCLCRLACGLYSGPARLEAVCPALLCVGLPRAFLLERARQRAVLSAGCVPPCFSSRCARLPTSTRAGIRRSISLPPAAASRPHASGRCLYIYKVISLLCVLYTVIQFRPLRVIPAVHRPQQDVL